MKGCSKEGLCGLCGISRQAYYAGLKQRKRRDLDEDFVLEQVRDERKRHPRMGTRKLLHQIQPALKEGKVRLGRDRLFELLRKKDMLVKPKRRWINTTCSEHNLPLYRNTLGDYRPVRANQVWVSDITYLRSDEGWLYLSLVTDLYSRKVVGWNLGKTLEASESVRALKMAIRRLPDDCHPVHHSDRGSQYCCREYVGVLLKRGLSISMTEDNHCAENCYAERINGILKNEYNLDLNFRNRQQALNAVSQAIEMYNNWRPHKSLAMAKPSQVHARAA